MRQTAVHLSLGAVSMLAPAAWAQAAPQLAQPTVRITAPISNDSLVTLKGNVVPAAKTQFDQGAAPASTETGRLELLLRPSAAQQSALRQYLGSVNDPHSALYHKWLTPTSYGANFGISDEDLAVVESWLRSEGFIINGVPASRNFIQFSGTFGQLAQAFHTSIHTYVIGGVQHYANATDPSIPAALAGVVMGVSPLNTFRPHPLFVQQLHGEAEKQGSKVQLVPDSLRSRTSPQYTASTNNGPVLLVTAADAATIYDSPNSLNGKFSGGTQYTGAGIKIGLVGDSDLPVQDYLNYRQLILGEANPPAPTLVVDGDDPGQVNDGSSEEALVDTEFSAALAPQASIYFYSSADSALEGGAVNAALRAIEDNTVSILSVSFGECEANLGAAGNQEISTLWQQAAAQGITVLVSSGDTGSASCDGGTSEETAQNGLSVNGLGSTPYNVSVGGTDFNVLADNFSQYVSTSATSGALYQSALGYIPENPWNESISNNPPGSYTTNTAEQYSDASTGSTYTLLYAAGGGPSSAAVCPVSINADGSCPVSLQGYATPSFQTGITVGGDNANAVPTGVRYLPDVSLFASSGSEHRATWLLCADSAVTQSNGSASTDCEADSNGQFTLSGIGGTSASSPAFAGILAMVAQSQGGGRLGLADAAIYNIYATNSNSGSIFHDVTAGNNSVPCASNTPNCGSNGFETGWNAGTGYDLASGLGSVDISKLISAWGQQQFTPTTLTLTAGSSANSLGTSPISITHGSSITFAAQVDPSAAKGDVSITGPTNQAGLAVNALISLTNGSGQVTTNSLPGGTYTVQGYYQGDVDHSPSTTSNSIAFTVAPEASLPFLSVYAQDVSSGTQTNNPTTLTYGEYGYAYVQPANVSANNSGTLNPDGFATGTVTLVNGGTAFPNTYFNNPIQLNSDGVGAFPLYNLAPGAYQLGAQYSGDASYNASSSKQSYPLTISKGPTTLTVHVGKATAAAPGMLQVELVTDSVGANPTGAVTLMINGNSYTGTAANEVLSSGAVAQLITYSVPAAVFSSGGGYNVSATYAGDGNYASSAAVSCTYVPPATTARVDATGLPPGTRAIVLAAGCSVCSLVFLLIPAKRRAWRSILVLCFAVGLIGVTGCGSTSNSGNNIVPVHDTCAQ